MRASEQQSSGPSERPQGPLQRQLLLQLPLLESHCWKSEMLWNLYDLRNAGAESPKWTLKSHLSAGIITAQMPKGGMQSRRRAFTAYFMLWLTSNVWAVRSCKADRLLLLISLVDHRNTSADAECVNICTLAA